MLLLIILVFIPVGIVCAGAWRLRGTISVAEAVVACLISVAVQAGAWYGLRAQGLQTLEYWNGVVSAKPKGTRPCCHCTTVCDSTDQDGNCTSSHEDCDHWRDYWWKLEFSTGDVQFSNCNSSPEPPRWWRDTRRGDPASLPHAYTNYLRADPESILHHTAEPEQLRTVPKFPTVGPYAHEVPKVLTDGTTGVPLGWQDELMRVNARLGQRVKRCLDGGEVKDVCTRLGIDLMVVLTSQSDPSWAHAVEAAWLYGPKNAFIVVIGMDSGVIAWARTVSISETSQATAILSHELPGKTLELETLRFIGQVTTTHVRRTPMAEFRYMLIEAQPRGWRVGVLFLLALALGIGLVVLVDRYDFFRRQYY
jgi:hypothetical protein